MLFEVCELPIAAVFAERTTSFVVPYTDCHHEIRHSADLLHSCWMCVGWEWRLTNSCAPCMHAASQESIQLI